MQIFRESINRSHLRLLNSIPTEIQYTPASPATLSFIKSPAAKSSCLGCINPHCLWFSEEEISCSKVENFPGDKTTDVCPVQAIKWDFDKERPVIDSRKCINCGLCASRCPVGAIYFNRKIVINYEDSNAVKCLPASDENAKAQREQLSKLQHVKRGGVLIQESDPLLEQIYGDLLNIRSNDHNTVVRNLLIGLGCNCSMRRIGDVYTRMDAVYSTVSESFGAVEVEFGRDTLDASRGILDDIAVLHTRYGIPKETNDAVVVCLQLPNARQGYWQVIRDIRIVEGLRINTVTVGALLLLLWNNRLFDPSKGPFYIDYDNMDLRRIIEHQLGKKVRLSHRNLGILEPMK